MEKLLTSVVKVDPDTAARIEKRAGETGLAPDQYVASLVQHEYEGD